MGYSISVKFSSESEKNDMKNFIISQANLIENLSKLSLGLENLPHSKEITEDLPYAPNNSSNLLGFNGSGIPRYLWDVCTWMSVKSTSKGKKPYIFYDDEMIKISFEKSELNSMLVDSDGIIIRHEKKLDLLGKIAKIVTGQTDQINEERELLIKLNDNWNHHKLQKKDTKKFKP